MLPFSVTVSPNKQSFAIFSLLFYVLRNRFFVLSVSLAHLLTRLVPPYKNYYIRYPQLHAQEPQKAHQGGKTASLYIAFQSPELSNAQ
jgi:hypothetical protein